MRQHIYQIFRVLVLAGLLSSPLPGSTRAGAAGGSALVKDVDASPYQPAFSAVTGAVEVGATSFFVGQDDTNGIELWASDGTPAGTRLVKDIAPGLADAEPAALLSLSGRLLFFANDAVHGRELWASDGTPAGTTLLKDISPGRAEGTPLGTRLTLSGGRAFFIADDAAHGWQLWASDGTPAGTTRVTGTDESVDRDRQIDADGILFFWTYSDLLGPTLWKSDGTPAGTLALRRFANPGAVFWPLGTRGRSLLFTVDGTLWRSDGTPAGTRSVADIQLFSGFPPGVALGDDLLFITGDAYNGFPWQLWRSDGTGGGTAVLKSFAAGLTLDAVLDTAVGGNMFFVTRDADRVPTLWVSDGTPAGTLPVKTFPEAVVTVNLSPTGGLRALTALDTTVAFVLTTTGQVALWSSDGTPAGTGPISALSGAPQGALGSAMARVAGRLLFTLAAGGADDQLWASDGSAAGTVLLDGADAVVDLSAPVAQAYAFARTCAPRNPDGTQPCGLLRTDGTAAGTTRPRSASSANGLAIADSNVIDGAYYVRLLAPPAGVEPVWKSDGTPAGTQPVPGASALPPAGSAYFFRGTELWRTDTTAAGAHLVRGGFTGYPRAIGALAGRLYFSNYNELWTSDGTAAGTRWLHTHDPPSGSSCGEGGCGTSFQMIALGNTALLLVQPGLHNELWASDGSVAGTTLLKVFSPEGVLWSTAIIGGRFYFGAEEALPAGQNRSGLELWASDGTAAGTALLKDIRPGPPGSGPSAFTVVDGRLYVSADDGSHGRELWVSDGTSAGTRQAGDIAPGSLSSDPGDLTAVDNQLYFTASDPARGRELWLSDSGGTRLVQDIAPGSDSGLPDQLATVNGQLYFTASDPAHGRELWLSDSNGTRLVQDLAPGARNANVAGLAVLGRRLLFFANDGVVGPALWSVALESAPLLPRRVGLSTRIEAEQYDRGGAGLAYLDHDPANQGGAYRPDEGVDLQSAGGRIYLSHAEAGEWLCYSFRATRDASHRVLVEVSSGGAGGTFHLEVDGADVSGPVRVPDTGGATNWRILRLPDLALSAGPHTLRLVLDANGSGQAVGNIDWLDLTASDALQTNLPVVSR